MSGPADALCFINAGFTGGTGSLRIVGDRIVGVGVSPSRGDLVVDLEGDRLLPGLINAHDHLQLNNFPRTRFRETHANAGEWIADIVAHKGKDASLAAATALDVESRLLAGGLKNLLSGVTTVAHHDPGNPFLHDDSFPVRVPADHCWAHSLAISGESEVTAAHRATPAGSVWIIHAGEGVNAAATAEFDQLERLGCIDERSLLVHALAFDAAQVARLVSRGAAVVWCPSSNLFLFDTTLDPRPLHAAGRLALGSDSRLSGARDLLAELRIARAATTLTDDDLELLVTRENARLLRLADRGTLDVGRLADLVVLPADRRLADLDRGQLRMVMVGGRMLYGDTVLASALGARADAVPVVVDGCAKILDRRLTERVARSAWREPGVVFPEAIWRAA